MYLPNNVQLYRTLGKNENIRFFFPGINLMILSKIHELIQLLLHIRYTVKFINISFTFILQLHCGSSFRHACTYLPVGCIENNMEYTVLHCTQQNVWESKGKVSIPTLHTRHHYTYLFILANF